jgi:hypothetical protein
MIVNISGRDIKCGNLLLTATGQVKVILVLLLFAAATFGARST